ncbi:MAG: histidine kinase, partial [Aquabacterium sp.]
VLEDLAELFRQALAAPQGRSTLADEIALSRRYLDIEQLRFGERLQVHWQLDPAANATVLPPLILQPLVENAVRHGVEPSAEGGWVSVQTQVQAGHMVLTVRNSVPQQGALPFAPGHGMALRNVRQRLQLMHDVQLGFTAGLKPAATQGESALYEVRVRVPLSEKEPA